MLVYKVTFYLSMSPILIPVLSWYYLHQPSEPVTTYSYFEITLQPPFSHHFATI